MDKTIKGRIYCLGDNIDTDQIIPAQYLNLNPAIEEERRAFGRYAFSGVPEGQRGLPDGNIPFIANGAPRSGYAVVVAGKNFGCGSSREHAPLAVQMAGVKIVIAEFYARIFFRNCVNGGYLIPLESAERLVDVLKTGDEVEVELRGGRPRLVRGRQEFALKPIGDILPIIEAGNVFEYARRSGMITKKPDTSNQKPDRFQK
ncbi:MAG: 3-isopropylmalate dehydratase, partial [Candidatus Omnitrophica bacterium]|nr:3-isopropylmalate dehydratase [Candidatus Omnitrophota bacterium]